MKIVTTTDKNLRHLGPFLPPQPHLTPGSLLWLSELQPYLPFCFLNRSRSFSLESISTRHLFCPSHVPPSIVAWLGPSHSGPRSNWPLQRGLTLPNGISPLYQSLSHSLTSLCLMSFIALLSEIIFCVYFVSPRELKLLEGRSYLSCPLL